MAYSPQQQRSPRDYALPPHLGDNLALHRRIRALLDDRKWKAADDLIRQLERERGLRK